MQPKSDAQEFIICTETGIFYNLQKGKSRQEVLCGEKKHQVCDDMKKLH